MDIIKTILDGITYDLVKIVVGSLIVSSGITIILRRFFDKFDNRKEEIKFWAICSVVICTLFFFLGTRIQEPKMTVETQGITAGRPSAPNNSNDTVAVITIGAINAGNMQTILKGWDVTAEINMNIIHGSIIMKPNDITMNTAGHGDNNPISITYKAVDNIIDKALSPIQSGSAVYGNLFVLFPNVDPDMFKNSSVITVTVQDALGKRYTSAIRPSGKFEVVPPLATLHTEMVCPARPGPLPAVPNVSPFVPKPSGG
jgi:hypothetical protein